MSADLFDAAAGVRQALNAPLAERMRPTSLEDVVGQQHILGKDKALRTLIESDQIPSLILWGPPGSGKTTLSRIIAQLSKAKFSSLSAVFAGVKDIRAAVDAARETFKFSDQHTILFIDEIHRFNKAQQDALLPHVEAGTITLVGATTENPSFEIIGPLLSRCRIFVLEPLSQTDLNQLLDRGLTTLEKNVADEARNFLLCACDGDARRLLNILEIAAHLSDRGSSRTARTIDLETAEAATQRKALLYDKNGEEHYNLISAFIKSMRASDADAAVYYLARMYEAGEDARFIARRMVIFASEDISEADPDSLRLAVAAAQAYDMVGQAEGWIPLSHAAIHLAQAPKSNETYTAYKSAKAEINKSGQLPSPLHIRNAPTKLMKDLGYGKGYAYPHTDPNGSRQQSYLPDKIRYKTFYQCKKPR